MEKKNFNEALKARELREKEENKRRAGENQMTLDDAARVKVLSPGMLVFKRFIRNRRAIVGSVILITMFLFAFLGPYFYRYGQTEVFNAYKLLNVNYASAVNRTEHTVYTVEDKGLSTNTRNMFNSIILTMTENETDWHMIHDDPSDQDAIVKKLGDNVYTMSVGTTADVASYALQDIGAYNAKLRVVNFTGEDLGPDFSAAVTDALAADMRQFEFNGVDYIIRDGSNAKEFRIVGAGEGAFEFAGEDLGDDFKELVIDGISNEVSSFELNGDLYVINEDVGGKFSVSSISNMETAYVSSTYVFDTVVPGTELSNEFKVQALLAIYGEGAFTADGSSYSVAIDGDDMNVYDASGEQFAAISTFVVRRYNGEDSLSIDFKETVSDVVSEMEAKGLNTSSFMYNIPQLNEDGLPVLDENGNEVLVESELIVTDKVNSHVVVCEQYTYMLDRFAPPSSEHFFGTDGDGMDILARMMAGGRISLLVGFIVVILEVILGIIMGGIAGYFGGWVDNLIMRLVDIFYCIPSMPILIILGSMLDSLRVEPYVRLMWLMAVLGFLGWAGVARLVRGQILSLREQDFMVATEASGLPVSRRIFRHLIPNVMPQLIVSATMGLGSVILTESTLSFLGLGVKHPMATWGTMINSVATSAQAMTEYTYIWIPVGCLICLTVIAFNFVGDGLRDAFDPKMKR
ncbi:MAG: ABC transporter permease [Clostridia bacterium]|nr:ABC transporter permease [Clostridia bacterium]